MIEDYSSTSKPSITTEPGPTNGTVFKKYATQYESPQTGGYQNFIETCGKIFGTCGVFCCLCSNPYKTVDQGNIGFVQKFGALDRAVDPGVCYVNTWSEQLCTVEMKMQLREIPPQTCLTKDNVSVLITSVLYYQVVDPQKILYLIGDINQSIIERTQTTLRDVIGSRNLQDVVEKREEIAESIEQNISKTAFDWGVSIESILIKDLTLPPQVQSSLSMAAEARRIGESKIINAKAEVESAKLMRKAADILSSKPAMQIRYLDAMQAMAKQLGSKVIFMPSAQEIERLSSDVSNAKYEKPRAEELDEDWAQPTELSPVNTGKLRMMDTIALQEAIKN